MGVSLSYSILRETRHYFTPGWRSMMHSLLLDNGLLGALDKDDIPLLLKLGREQYRGQKEPPFDYAEDIHRAFRSLARAIRKHGSIVVYAEF